ncbi:L-aspartate oxidase [Leifsonia poae]|uniref:L-aspartate oxidase n=1 Tax=Leifsonia poae TaxID=110933 RepID=A0A9W6H5U7_9MICO|nr:L-aspartate oxidase [Leifsonia poae]GLJ74434.1 L-aspartate oxidase [Leifsonia poae]
MADIVVVGSGVAGLVAALEASRRHRVTVVTKAELSESNTAYAQGGIAAAVFPDDTVEAHIADTLRAGAGLAVPEAVEVLCAEGPARIRDLIAFGVAFDRAGDELARGLEAAHSSARVLHAGGDATGAEIERALVRSVLASAARVVEHAFLTEIVVGDGTVRGVVVSRDDGTLETLEADAVILASGGAGRLYAHTTNPAVTTGDGVAAAWRAGAALADLEFYQFHPTALATGGSFLISEAVRGEGAVLLNRTGERFMLDVHPDAELAPRDVVARGIAVEMAAQDGEPVLLDATALGADFLARRFPTIDAACRAAGLDWSRQPIPVTPAAHYWMGGVASDTAGRTTLPGLYAVGEVACTGAHGANRLASNSLLESIVFAHRAAADLADGVPAQAEWGGPTWLRDAGNATIVPLATAPDATTVDRAALQALLWEAAGLHRTRETLERARLRLAQWTAADAPAGRAEREDANLLDLARLVVDAALSREESRGAHFRSDFPFPAAGPARHSVSGTVAADTEVTVPC